MHKRAHTQRHTDKEKKIQLSGDLFFVGESSPFQQQLSPLVKKKNPQCPMHQVRTMKREAYLEVREVPFITIVVVVFGVVLIHSSSVGWTEVEIKKG